MSYVTLSYVILSKLSYVIRLMNILMEKGQNEKTMFKIKFGVKCLQCSRIFFDKSNLNRHSAKEHKGLDVKFESNVAYVEKDGVIRETCDWEVGPLPAVCLTLHPLHQDAWNDKQNTCQKLQLCFLIRSGSKSLNQHWKAKTQQKPYWMQSMTSL